MSKNGYSYDYISDAQLQQVKKDPDKVIVIPKCRRMPLATMQKLIRASQPQAVIIDPISNLMAAGTTQDAQSMVLRLIDHLKGRGITALMTNLSTPNVLEETEIGISSVIDTWLLLRDIELGGERNRGLYVLKSRGMKHSNQIREFLLTDEGIHLVEVYAGPDGVLTGSMRVAQESSLRASARSRSEEMERKRREILRKKRSVEAQMASRAAELEAQEDELARLAEQGRSSEARFAQEHADMARSRGSGDPNARGHEFHGKER